MPVYPSGSKVTLQLALIISYGPRDVLLKGRMWASSLMQDFSSFPQTWSLYQLTSTFENTVPRGLYRDPFSFITSGALSVVGVHSRIWILPQMPCREVLLWTLSWRQYQAAASSSLSHEIPSYKNYLSFGHLCHRACVEGSRTLVRGGSTMWHQTQAITFGNKYGGCFPSEQSAKFSLLLRQGLVCLRMASNSLWGWGWTIKAIIWWWWWVCVRKQTGHGVCECVWV